MSAVSATCFIYLYHNCHYLRTLGEAKESCHWRRRQRINGGRVCFARCLSVLGSGAVNTRPLPKRAPDSVPMSDAPYILHIWPSKWNLQSLDPTCLAAVMYLQLTIPGKFKVAPCTNPDKSPNGKHPFRVGPMIVLTMCIGQLPFLTHGHVAVSTFPSIVAFVASLAKSSGASGAIDLDASLTSLQKAERVALYAHVEACISDLVVSHSCFANVLLPIDWVCSRICSSGTTPISGG